MRSIRLPDEAALTARLDRKLLGGAVVIGGAGLAASPAGWKGTRYRPLSGKGRKVRVKAIPYCLWDNRAPGAMAVWLPRA